VPHPSSADQLVFVVADPEVYERLKEEVSLNQVAIGKLEESIQTIHSQVMMKCVSELNVYFFFVLKNYSLCRIKQVSILNDAQ